MRKKRYNYKNLEAAITNELKQTEIAIRAHAIANEIYMVLDSGPMTEGVA